MIKITSGFESGNIIVKTADDPSAIRLEIAKDHQSDFYQWFYFRITGARDQKLKLTIENAAGAAYAFGWPDYRAVVSSDHESWERVDTAYESGELIIDFTPDSDSVWVAYFAPYLSARHDQFIAWCQQSPLAKLDIIGTTLDGRDIDRLTVGGTSHKKKTIWVTARQHPGETMAEWAAEGFLERLLDEADPVSRAVLSRAVIHIVPNLNPDGSFRGHLRTNAKGINLNREWDKASLENSPEVFSVLSQMDKTGVDLFLDMHGDEALPYNFIAGAEGNPGFTDDALALLMKYKTDLMSANPDFQIEQGYPVQSPGQGNMSVATNAIAHRYNCLAMTLEMPFKDSAITPDQRYGWSPERSKHLGASQLDAMLGFLSQ